MSGLDQPRQRRTLSEAAYQRIKSDIIDGSLAPNRVVSVNALADTLGFSIGPIRAALHRLSGEDLVEALPQHGYRILPVTLRDVLKLYEVLAIMLPNTARLAARNPRIGKQLPRMAKLNAVCNAPRPPADPDEERAVIEAGRALSRLIAAGADNPFLLQILTGLFQQGDRLLHLWRKRTEHPIDFRRDYSQVIESLRHGDEERAADAIAAMVVTSRSHLVAGLLDHPDFSDVSIS